MINILKIFLSTILVSSSTVVVTETIDQLFVSSLQDSPFHPDIKITNSANQKNYKEAHSGWNGADMYAGTTEIKWTSYANSWEQFKKYYQTISLDVSGHADGKGATKKSFTNLNIAVSSLEVRSSWRSNDILRASGSQWCLAYTGRSYNFGSYNRAGVYYDVFRTDSYIKLRFHLWTNMEQKGTDWIWAESFVQYNGGTISSSWNLSKIETSLNTALANQIDLASDYSGSLEDKRNINDPTGKGNDETTLIDSVIAKILGDEYNAWKQYIQPFAFSNTTREATIIFKFPDPVTNQQKVWTFHTPINITLSPDYWGKSLSERLHIFPGKIVNPEDSTKGMIDDTPLQLEPDQVTTTYGGNLQYHTSAHIEFDGMENSSEWMTVNGQPVEVLNNKFVYNMVDNRVDTGEKDINVFDIIIYHDDGTYKEQYQIKYTISNLVPTLQAKWYAWDPEKNPDQKKLITPTLPNGKPNPAYDKEVNVKTGTKTQILWVKKKSQYPFPLDPLNQAGEVIDPEKNKQDYDLGFIAEGSVAGMGVQQLFNPNEVKSVLREGVDNALNQFPNPAEREKLTTIIPDVDNKYWSWQGMWHYITKTTDGLAYEKYALIGAKYQDKYPRFLDILNDSNIAVDFWTTIHGVHLKNYLAKYKDLDSKVIGNLNYEQVASYWKEYTSDIIAQRIAPDPTPANYQDLSKISFETMKMNLTTVDLIRQEIIKQVKEQMVKKVTKANLIYEEDYQFQPFDDQTLKQLLAYDSKGNATITLNINALATSTKATGSNTIKVINNIHYDPDQVIDLSEIKFKTQIWDFSEFTVDKLRENYIKKPITKRLNEFELVYQTDYGVRPLDEESLSQFLKSEIRVSLIITIYSQDDSLKTKNSTTLELINDPNADPAPPDPDPDPSDNGSWIAKKQNLIIMSVVAALVVSSVALGVFFKYRFKRGIGGKQIKRKKNNGKKNHDGTPNDKLVQVRKIKKSEAQHLDKNPKLFLEKIKLVYKKTKVWFKPIKKYCLLIASTISSFFIKIWNSIKRFCLKFKPKKTTEKQWIEKINKQWKKSAKK